MKCNPGTTEANRPKAAAETHTSKKSMEFLLVTAPEIHLEISICISNAGHITIE